MAVTVGSDNNRIESAETTTGWSNIGGGGGVSLETDIVYSGSGAASRKVSTTTLGRGWTNGGTTDQTATDRRHILVKVTATNPAALQTRATPALEFVMGTSASDYYHYRVAGSDAYPAKGGWLLIPISPNVSGYRDATTGTVGALTAMKFFGVIGDFTAGSKSENLVIDAIDAGAGLHLTGGTPAGTWDDFVSHDQGTQSNRWGYITEQDEILFVLGRIAIGENAVGTASLTDFSDSGRVIVWGNGYAETGFHELLINVSSSSGTFISMDNCTLISTGELNNTVGGRGYTTTEDTRTNLTFVGTVGDGSLDECLIKNFGTITLTSTTSLVQCDVECALIDHNNGSISGTVRTTSLSAVATIVDPVAGKTLNDIQFVQAGAGHAIEFTTATTRTLTDVRFEGYGANTTNNAAIFINLASGSITLNVVGGQVPTYRLPAASTCVVTINNNVNVTFNDIITSPASRIYVEATATVGSVTTGDELVNAVATDPYTYVHNYEGDLTFTWRVRNASSTPKYKSASGTGTITSTGAIINVTQQLDE